MPNDPGVSMEVPLEDHKHSASLLQELNKWYQFWAIFLEGDNEKLWQHVFDADLIKRIRTNNDTLQYWKVYPYEELNEQITSKAQEPIKQAKQLHKELCSKIQLTPSEHINIDHLEEIKKAANNALQLKNELSKILNETEDIIKDIKGNILGQLNPNLRESIIEYSLGNTMTNRIFGENGKLENARTVLKGEKCHPLEILQQINVLNKIITSLKNSFINQTPTILENYEVQNLIAQRKILTEAESHLKISEVKMNTDPQQGILQNEIEEISNLLVQLPKRNMAAPSKLMKSRTSTNLSNDRNLSLSQSTRLGNTSERQRNSVQLAPTGQLRRSRSMFSFPPLEETDPVAFYCSREKPILIGWYQDIELRLKLLRFYQTLQEENELVQELEKKLKYLQFFTKVRWETIHTMPQNMLDHPENLQLIKRDIDALLGDEGLITTVDKELNIIHQIHDGSKSLHSQLLQNKENIRSLSDQSKQEQELELVKSKYKDLMRRFETLRTEFNQQRFRIAYMMAFVQDKQSGSRLTTKELENSGNPVLTQLKTQKWFFISLDETKENNPDSSHPVKETVAEFFTNIIRISIPSVTLTIKVVRIEDSGITKNIVLENGLIEESKEIKSHDNEKLANQPILGHFFGKIIITCTFEKNKLKFESFNCSGNPYIRALLLSESQILDEGLALFNEITGSRQNIAIKFEETFTVIAVNKTIESFQKTLTTLPLFNMLELKYLIDGLKPVDNENLELKCLELYLFMRTAINAIHRYIITQVDSIRTLFPKKNLANLTVDTFELDKIPETVEIPAVLTTLVAHLDQVCRAQEQLLQELNNVINNTLRMKKQYVEEYIATLLQTLSSNGYRYTEFENQLSRTKEALLDLTQFLESIQNAKKIIKLNKWDSLIIEINNTNIVDTDKLSAQINRLRLQYEIVKINQDVLQVVDRTIAAFSENFLNLLPSFKSENLETLIKDYLQTLILLMSPQQLFEFLIHFDPQMKFILESSTKVVSPISPTRATHGFYFDSGDFVKHTKEVKYVVDWLSLLEQPYSDKIVAAISTAENKKIAELLENYLKDNENTTSLEKAKQFVLEIIPRLILSLRQDNFFDLFNHMTQHELRRTFLEKSKSNITYFLLKTFIEQGYTDKQTFIEQVRQVIDSFCSKVKEKHILIEGSDTNGYKFESKADFSWRMSQKTNKGISIELFCNEASLYQQYLNDIIVIFQDTIPRLYNLLLNNNSHVKSLYTHLRKTLSLKDYNLRESVYMPFNIIILYTLSITITSIIQEYTDHKDIQPYIYNLAEATKYCGIIGDPDSAVKLPEKLTALVKYNEGFIKNAYKNFGLEDDEITEFLSERLHPTHSPLPIYFGT
ncbi:MAG: hypothetical protein AMJ43_01480 [Coxiella sp. DG_40]|nr:MAG: hypothetical protein AMJ43_01480 [Coxiella sp. DG_40]